MQTAKWDFQLQEPTINLSLLDFDFELPIFIDIFYMNYFSVYDIFFGTDNEIAWELSWELHRYKILLIRKDFISP